MIDGYQSATDLFGAYRLVARKGGSERATLLGWFATKTGIEIGHVAVMLAHVKDERDLYFLQSDMEHAHLERSVPYSASFRNALKVDRAMPVPTT